MWQGRRIYTSTEKRQSVREGKTKATRSREGWKDKIGKIESELAPCRYV